MTENLSEKLEQLSAAATQGEWREAGGDAILTGHDSSLVVIGSLTASENDPLFVSTLVNTFRTGQLVAVQADDAIERYRHVKRGTVYEVVGEAELQMNADNLVDGSQMMVYRGEDGKLWCRHYDEFHDGRFAALAAKGAGGE